MTTEVVDPPAITTEQEISDGLAAALPMLVSLRGTHRRLQEIEFHADTASGLPTTTVLLRAYGNMMQDHPLSGVWKLAQEGYGSVYIWSREAGITLHDRVDRTARLPEGRVEEGRALECVRLLGVIRQEFDKQRPAVVGAESTTLGERRRRGLGRMLLGRRH